MSDLQKYKMLLDRLFSGSEPEGYSLEKYYGVMIMKIKRNNKYQIRLQYDYKNRNMINGKPVEFTSPEAAMNAYVILDKFSISNTANANEDIENMLIGE